MKVILTPTNWNTEKDPAFYDDLKSTFPDVTFATATTVEEQKELIRDADAFYGSMNSEVFLAAEKLRWVHVPGVGVDHIAIPELMDSDVILLLAWNFKDEIIEDLVASGYQGKFITPLPGNPSIV